MAAAATMAPESVPDDELVASLRLGDEDAFQTLYDRYFQRIYNFVGKRLNHNRADTEEVVQEVFINLFSSIHTFRGDAPFVAWVFGLTRRTIAGRFKKVRATTVPLAEEHTRDLEESSQTPRQPGPLEAYEYSERLTRMEGAMDGLSEEQRQVFRLHHIDHHSIQDIARSISKSENSVKSNLYRVRKVLLAH